MTYEEWLISFLKDKKEAESFDEPRTEAAAHTFRSYIDSKGQRWETAFTYTGRLLVRSGIMTSGRATPDWTQWETCHGVDPLKV